MAQNYYKVHGTVLDGINVLSDGDVVPGTPSLDAWYERNEGKNANGDALIEQVSADEYAKARSDNPDLVTDEKAEVVTGEGGQVTSPEGAHAVSVTDVGPPADEAASSDESDEAPAEPDADSAPAEADE